MPDVHARGLRFKVHTMGSGDRVAVLIHGIGIDNSSSHYFLLAPALSPLCSVVCYDLRGHGESEVPAGGYTFEHHVLDLEAVLRELGLGERAVALVGTSLGGRIAIEFALRFPEHVDRIALLDSELVDLRESAQEVAQAIRQGRKAVEQSLRKAWDRYLRDHTVDGQLDHDARMFKLFLEQRSNRRRTLRLALRLNRLVWETSFVDDLTLEAPPEPDQLSLIACPVLGLYGEHAPGIHTTGRQLLERVPRCTIESVPDCGHFVIYKTDIVRAALQRFLFDGATPA